MTFSNSTWSEDAGLEEISFELVPEKNLAQQEFNL